MEQQPTLPRWILFISSFFAFMGLVVTLTLCFSPQAALKTVDLSAKGVDYLIYMWAARQFACGFIFAFATYKKSAPMLTLAFLFFLVMNIGDFIIGLQQHDPSLYGGAGIMCIVAPVMIYLINKPAK